MDKVSLAIHIERVVVLMMSAWLDRLRLDIVILSRVRLLVRIKSQIRQWSLILLKVLGVIVIVLNVYHLTHTVILLLAYHYSHLLSRRVDN